MPNGTQELYRSDAIASTYSDATNEAVNAIIENGELPTACLRRGRGFESKDTALIFTAQYQPPGKI